MKTIVVATDFSDNANNALQYAAALASYTKARIILFNAYQLPVHASNTLLPAASVLELIKSNKRRLEDIASEITGLYEVSIKVHTNMANVSEALDEIVEMEKADLVVIGIHASDWSDHLFGNTTTSIIRNAKYPVLVVPDNVTFNGIERILYAFDANCLTMGNKLKVVKDIASNFKAEVQVFHVDTSKRKTANAQKELTNPSVEGVLPDVEYSYKETEAEGVVKGIENGILEYGANLLVMVPHKLSFWRSLANASVTRALVLRTNIPLLVVPNTSVESLN